MATSLNAGVIWRASLRAAMKCALKWEGHYWSFGKGYGRVMGILLQLGWIPGGGTELKGPPRRVGGCCCVGVCCSWGCPTWGVWVCSPAKQELGQVSGMLVRLPKSGLTSVVVLPGTAPSLGLTGLLLHLPAGRRGKVEPQSLAQSPTPCLTCPVCSACPAGLCLSASCCLL